MAANSATPLHVTPIGRIRTPFTEQAGTPIQPWYGRDVEGRVELEEAYRDALADLDRFDRVWLLSWLDRAGDWTPKVVPYRDTVERGLFSTRAPRRPNPIGLHLVEVAGVEGSTLIVRGVDLLDNTPILDIKPYVPRFEAVTESRAGWLDDLTVDREEADERFEE